MTVGLASPDDYFAAADRRNFHNPNLSFEQKCKAWELNDMRRNSIKNLMNSMPELNDDPKKKRKFMEAMHIQSGFGSADPLVAVAEKLADKHLTKSLKEEKAKHRAFPLAGTGKGAEAGGGDAARLKELEAQLAESKARAAALEAAARGAAATSAGARGGGKGSFMAGGGCWWCGSKDHKAKDPWGNDTCPDKIAGKPKKA